MANKDSYIPASDLWEMINTGLRKTNSGTDKGTLGKNGASRVIKKDNVASDSFGLYTQRIANGNNNTISDISLQHNLKNVRTVFSCSDFIINNHKFNSYMYEITNFKQLQDTAIGNFTVMGTVLVKTYDPNLEKWVLIRRQVRVPMFSNLLDSYYIDERLEVTDNNTMIQQYLIEKDNNKNGSNSSDDSANNGNSYNSSEDIGGVE